MLRHVYILPKQCNQSLLGFGAGQKDCSMLYLWGFSRLHISPLSGARIRMTGIREVRKHLLNHDVASIIPKVPQLRLPGGLRIQWEA